MHACCHMHRQNAYVRLKLRIAVNWDCFLCNLCCIASGSLDWTTKGLVVSCLASHCLTVPFFWIQSAVLIPDGIQFFSISVSEFCNSFAGLFVCRDAAADWGLQCMRYEIRDISPPTGVRAAMELQVRPYFLLSYSTCTVFGRDKLGAAAADYSIPFVCAVRVMCDWYRLILYCLIWHFSISDISLGMPYFCPLLTLVVLLHFCWTIMSRFVYLLELPPRVKAAQTRPHHETTSGKESFWRP